MKRNLLISAWLVFGLVLFSSQSWAQCPQDTVDSGECDTLYVEVYPPDQEPYMFPTFARFPIYVTHDVPDPNIDSIRGFVIPLCYTHTNPSKYCSLSNYWNNTYLYPFPTDRSIFRHFIEGQDTVVHNWMMDLSQQGMGQEWNTRILDLHDQVSTFRFCVVPSGSPDQAFWGGSRVLLATMTFKLEDSMTICIDSCFWPPTSRLVFSRYDAKTYIPRHFLPVCEYVGWPPWPPPVWFTECPWNETRHTNETFISGKFEVVASDGVIISVAADFVGGGLNNVGLSNVIGLYTPYVTGNVVYEVIDHCQSGGTITITAWDDLGQTGDCDFDVVLSSTPPTLNLPDIWFALTDYTMGLHVSADDPDNDSVVSIVLDALWYEPDSLQPPANPPYYDGGNPGFFTWVPTEADTGTWICLFSATDICGTVGSHQMTIRVDTLFCGDCNSDEYINVGDLVFLIGYLYKGAPAPDPFCKGDANCDGVVDVGDLVYLINYLFKFGPAPCFECCAGGSAGAFTKPHSSN